MEEAGFVPANTAASIRAKGLALEPARIDEIERTTKHDVIAFLTHVEELAGIEARWLHRGMTSSDVLDTALAILLRDATDALVSRRRIARAPRDLRGTGHVRRRAGRALRRALPRSRAPRARPRRDRRR